MIKCEFENGNKAFLRHVVVDNLVIKDSKILLVKMANKLLEAGKWGVAGGFMKRDETIKEAVARETLEETGYKVDGITLLRIIDTPNRSGEGRQNISFVYFCRALGKNGIADSESEEQKWFDLSNLPAKEEIAFDHFDSIELYKKYLIQPFSLPQIN